MKNSLRILQAEPASTEPAWTEPAWTEPEWTEPERTEPEWTQAELFRQAIDAILPEEHDLSLELAVPQTVANLDRFRAGDELLRSLMRSTCALTFAIRQGLLLLYAAAKRLHLVREISSWDVVTLLPTLYLFVGGPVPLRRHRQSGCIGSADRFKPARAC